MAPWTLLSGTALCQPPATVFLPQSSGVGRMIPSRAGGRSCSAMPVLPHALLPPAFPTDGHVGLCVYVSDGTKVCLLNFQQKTLSSAGTFGHRQILM